MRETSRPVLATPDHPSTLPALLSARLSDAPDHVAFRRDGVDITTAEFAEQVAALARAWHAAGIRPGDAIACMAPTRYEWALVDFAAGRLGAVVVAVYDSSADAQISQILAEVPVAAAVVDTREVAERWRSTFGIDRVWTMAPSDDSLAALIVHAPTDDATLPEPPTPDAIATIVHTSGTEGRSKGVLVTHRNLVDMALNVAAAYPDVVHDRATTLIFLPMAHILARALQVCAVGAGMRISHLGDPTGVLGALADARPTFLVVVPRVLEKVRDAARTKASAAHIGTLYRRAERVAIDMGRLREDEDAGRPARPALALRLAHRLFDALFYRRARALLGGRLGFLLSGAAPLDADLSLFFRGMGLPVVEGYGLTETTAPATGNRPGAIRSGTVGPPMPGTTIRIADDGEVCVRGIGVCAGYVGGEPHLDDEGFFLTGDLGELDDDGYLRITGRTKDIVVTSSGKNINPAPWEAVVQRDLGLQAVLLVGDARPYPTAILVAEGETPFPGVTVDDPNALVAAERAVTRANTDVSRAEQVKRFVLVRADLAGVMTPTQKVRRADTLESAADLIDGLY